MVSMFYEFLFVKGTVGTFPNADISGYLFHMCSSIWKKILAVGLQVQYDNDQEFAVHLT